jgi:hypothetical protein
LPFLTILVPSERYNTAHRPPPQKADRFCSPSHSPGSAMVAEAQDRRRRFQLRGARSHRHRPSTCLPRHKAAARRQSVRADARTPSGAKTRRRGWPRLVEMRQYRRVALCARIFINHRATQRCRAAAEPLFGPTWTKPDPLQALRTRCGTERFEAGPSMASAEPRGSRPKTALTYRLK